MNYETTAVDLNNLSTKELESILAQRREAEEAEQQQKRKNYEAEREGKINFLGKQAETLFNLLSDFKGYSMNELTAFRAMMLEYGDLRKGERNKGSFTLKNDRYKVEFSTQICKSFDERAELAEGKLKVFMSSFLKKKAHKDVVEIITSLLEKGKNGEYDINLINRLYAMKDRFKDSNWREAIELFQESYSPTGTAQYIRFSRALPNGQWESLVLDFAKVRFDAQPLETA